MSTTPSEPEKAIGDAARSEAAKSVEDTAADHAAAEYSAKHSAGEAVGDGLGEGSPRYADQTDEIPPSGSEESWSAAPKPGYRADPDSGMDGKRLAAGVLVGALVLTAGVFVGYSLLTAKSPNGNGTASWTAAVTKDGAVVQGINAQNNVGSKTALSGGTAQAVQSAVATCDAATGNSKQLTATTGTVAGIGNWAIKATPSVNDLKNDAANLSTAVTGDDAAGIANSAQALCTAFTKVSALPAMPDAAGSAAWAAGITAYADAANNALKGANGDSTALTKAAQDLTQGNTQMNTLSARIIAAT